MAQYQCTDLPAHEKAICGDYLKGGIVSVGLLESDHTITNFSTASQYTTNINAGKLVLIDGIKAELPAPSPVEGENPVACGSETILDNMDRTVTWKDFNVEGNVDLYDAMNLKQTKAILYECTNEKVTVIDALISWTAFRVIPASNKEKQYFQVTGKWTLLAESQIYTAPSGIFNQ